MNPLRFLSGCLLLLFSAASLSARPYDLWKQTAFGPNAGNPAVAGDAADPDNDGWVNAVEYAFGSDPTQSSAPQWESTGGATSLKLLFHRAERSDLDLFLERSEDMTPPSWQVVARSLAGSPFVAVDTNFEASESPAPGGDFDVLVKQVAPAVRSLFRVRAAPASLIMLDVTPGITASYAGQTRQFTATGMYSDGAQEDLTELCAWSSSNTITASVSNAPGTRGLARALATGTSSITASLNSISGSATLDVQPVVLTSIDVLPGSPALNIGQTVQMTATGNYSDGSTADITSLVVWSSSLFTVATISNASGSQGLASAAAAGSTVLTAQLGMISGSTALTVNGPALLSIAVTPANSVSLTGETRQFTATGSYSDMTTADITTQVTWSSSNITVATISNAQGSQGLATALTTGQTTITATLGLVSGSTDFTVLAIPFVVSVSPTAGALNVDPLTTVTITFSEPMNPATLTGQSAPGAPAGSVQVSRDNFATGIALLGPMMSSGNTVATFVTNPALSNGTSWQVRVTTDAASASGPNMSSTFVQATGWTTTTEPACPNHLVISQVYGGGGNTGTLYTHDFIEIHNPTLNPISVSGHSVQYASAAGSTWNRTNLPALSIPSGGYLLIQQGTGGGGTTALPAPEATGSILMSATTGKVALCNNTTTLTGANPVSAAIIDRVSWGSTATGFEGSGPAPGTTNTTALLRHNAGSTDTDQNSSDFHTGAPFPRNSASPRVLSFCANNETGRADEADYAAVIALPFTVQAGTATPALFARICEAGRTEGPGPDATILCQIGYGPVTSNPENQTLWTWADATYNLQVGNDDEYMLSFTAPSTPGVYKYGARFSVDGLNWTYADSDGAGANPGLFFDTYMLPDLIVTP